MPVATAADESPNLGACLRRLRFDRRLSIADVAVATGIAKSTLSRVENDQLSLTYAKLLQLCRGLQIDLAELFSRDRSAEAPRPSGRRTHTPPGAGHRVRVGKLEYNYVCTELAGKKLTPMLGRIAARTLQDANGLWTHDGEEFAYVLRGRLQLHTAFYEPLVVEKGGSVYFDSTMGHAYVSIGDEPLEILCVASTPDLLLKSAEAATHHGTQAAAPATTAQGRRLKSRSSKS
ncbi:MAG: helix-turn-helix domain-containing protein [Gammaproteobacteria bacterium]